MPKHYDRKFRPKSDKWPNKSRRDDKYADLIRGQSKTASFKHPPKK